METTAERPNVRKIIAEAVTDGLSPELAAEMLLEPSRWEKMLFDTTRDLQTMYKAYLKGQLGVGELAAAVGNVTIASGNMMDLADSVVQAYGTDATPGEIPSSSDVQGEAEPEEESVEVIAYDDDGETVTRILDSIKSKWDAGLLDRLYSEPLEEADLYAQGISAEDLRDFEQGRFFNNVADSARKVSDLMRQVAQLYNERNWPELAQLYAQGGPIDMETAGLAGDVMVLRDVAQAAVRSGYGHYPVKGMTSFEPQLRRQAVGEAWSPAFVDPAYLLEVAQLYQVMSQAASGNITYDALYQSIQPYAKTGSPIFNMARRQSRGGQFRTPFTFDQKNVTQLASPESTLAKGPGPEPTTPTDVPGAFQDVTAASQQAQQELGIGQPPEAAPAPEPPAAAPGQPPIQKAVSQAITGMPNLADIFQPEQVPGVVAADTYSNLLGLQPTRAKQFSNYLQAKGKDPNKFAGMLKDAFAVMQQLGLTRGGWRSFAKTNPDQALKAQHAMQSHIKKKLEAGEEVMSHDLARIGVRALSSI